MPQLSKQQQTIEEPVTRNLLTEFVRPFGDIEQFDVDRLLPWLGQSKVVLLGESTHGTREFYLLRQHITRQLIERHGFNIIAVEADWPDAMRVDLWARKGEGREPPEDGVFDRFPRWMWRNDQVLEFVEWLRTWNLEQPLEKRAGFHGLDLYSLNSSIHEILRFLDDREPELGKLARQRYSCILPYTDNPEVYGSPELQRSHRDCENEVSAMLADLLRRRIEQAIADGHDFFDAEQNARIIRNAERYYRAIYRGPVESWNVRDSHMFETLLELMGRFGKDSKAIIWAHNSHIGDASATEMGSRGEHNIGQLVREHFQEEAALIGMGTHEGTVSAAADWGAPMQVMQVRPSLDGSYERISHESGIPRFVLDLRKGEDTVVRMLSRPRPERAIGVIYRPETERLSHYFEASLSAQFDAWLWLDETKALTPLRPDKAATLPGQHPLKVYI